MQTNMKLVVLAMLAFVGADEKSMHSTCGNYNSEDVQTVINSTVARLIQLRQATWGWASTPEAVLGIQLSAQKQFFGRQKAIQRMETEIKADLKSMNIGKLALYVTSLQSSCQNPRNFAGRDLVKILNIRVHRQFYYDGAPQNVPYDRYFRFGLALGAMCVNNETTRVNILKKLFQGQNADGSFGVVHSYHDSAQILLALSCIRDETRPINIKRKIEESIQKLVAFMKSNITTSGSDIWLGNKFSTPHSALALKESGQPPDDWHCRDAMRSLTVAPEANEQEGALTQRLPALKGNSYLILKSGNWHCEDPVPIPPGYQPSCDPSKPKTCAPSVPTMDSPPPLIDVQLTVFTDAPPEIGTEPNANVYTSVEEGSTLLKAMIQARVEGKLAFQTRTTAWGESIVSLQGVAANRDAHEYWSLIDGTTGKPLSRGASSYIVSDGEQIVFRMKTW